MLQENNQKLIKIKIRRLQKLKEEQSLKGLNAPPELLIEIEDLEAEIEQMQAKLKEQEDVAEIASQINLNDTQIEKSKFTLKKEFPLFSLETDSEIPSLVGDKSLNEVLESFSLSRQGKDTYFWGILAGIMVGALFCIAGFIIIILALIGSTEWILDGEGFMSRLSNAVPGVALSIIGMIILWRYKPKVKKELRYRNNSWEYKEESYNLMPPADDARYFFDRNIPPDT